MSFYAALMGLGPEQREVAQGFTRAPSYAKAGPLSRQALIEAGIVESSLRRDPSERNLDSRGALQQRASQGWGTVAEELNPTTAAEMFLRHAIPLEGRYKNAGELAQAVQRSAFPGRYDEHAAEAASLLAQLGGSKQGQQALKAAGVTQSTGSGPNLTALIAALSAPQSASVAGTTLQRPASSGGSEQAATSPRVPSRLTPAPPPSQVDQELLAKIGQAAPESAGGQAAPASEVAASSGHYVNPLPGFTKGGTDMGVDLSAKPGTPIKAIGNAKVLAIYPNWYQGQPYVSYELQDGPQKGKIVYVAEQITPTVKAGQQVRAGQQIGVYAPTGTGIETGYGTRGWQTQAQASGNTGDATHGNAPAGIAFQKLLEQLGVR